MFLPKVLEPQDLSQVVLSVFISLISSGVLGIYMALGPNQDFRNPLTYLVSLVRVKWDCLGEHAPRPGEQPPNVRPTRLNGRDERERVTPKEGRKHTRHTRIPDTLVVSYHYSSKRILIGMASNQ